MKTKISQKEKQEAGISGGMYSPCVDAYTCEGAPGRMHVHPSEKFILPRTHTHGEKAVQITKNGEKSQKTPKITQNFDFQRKTLILNP